MPDTIDEIRSLWDMSYKVRALIYGDAGVGKTIFACHSPKPVLLDADGSGALSLINHPELVMENDIKVLQVRSFNQMLDVFEAIKRGDPRVADRETVIIDTLSNLAQKHLDEFIAKEMRTNTGRDPVAFQRDYKFNTQAMRQLVGFFMQLDINLVCLAHETADKDELTQIVKLRPELTPKLTSLMEGIFDVFGYMTSDTDDDFVTHRALQIMPSRRVKAKTRIGGLPPRVADPIFTHFIWAKEQMVNRLEEMRAQYEISPYQPVAQADTTPSLEEVPVLPPEGETATEADQQEPAPLVVGSTFNLTPEGSSAA
jgi:phage nucleotide-binding protein